MKQMQKLYIYVEGYSENSSYLLHKSEKETFEEALKEYRENNPNITINMENKTLWGQKLFYKVKKYKEKLKEA